MSARTTYIIEVDMAKRYSCINDMEGWPDGPLFKPVFFAMQHYCAEGFHIYCGLVDVGGEFMPMVKVLLWASELYFTKKKCG